MRGTVKKITDFISAHHLLRPGMKVLCAVSGGADSICLLHVLTREKDALGITLAAAHYEHGIRGEESQRDAAFTEKFCREKGIDFICGHGDVPSYAEEHHLGLEEAARIKRYEFLYRCADDLGCDVIATAHNLEDNAETVLFHLARGTGLKGLCGIAPKSGRLIRPLLSVSREEIEAYLKEEGIPWVDDSSNASDLYARNRLRHHVLPELRKVNPTSAEAILRASELLRLDEEALGSMAESFVCDHYDGSSLPAKALLEQPFAVASRVVRLLCPRPLEAGHVESILALAGSPELGYADVPGLRVKCEQGRLYFTPEESRTLPETEIVPGMDLILPDAGLRVRAEILIFPEKVNALLIPFTIKCGEIDGRVKMTSRRSGDAFRPAGRGCTKTLKKLFLEQGLTQRERDTVPVFRDDRGILGVYGFAVDERAVPAAGDKVLAVTIESVQKEIYEQN